MLYALLFSCLIFDLSEGSDAGLECARSIVDSPTLRVKSKELSEDMHLLSSKNDEILVLIYEQLDYLAPLQLAVKSQLRFDQKNRVRRVRVPLEKWPIDGELILFLIEQDSETPITQLDPVIRLQSSEIMNEYKKDDYVMMEEYLGDEDLLGVKYISNWDKENVSVEFSGYYKLDKFEYLINLTK